MPARQVVFTVLTGGYEALQEQPAAIGDDIDRVCLTDDPTLTSTSWQVRHISLALPADAVRSARRMKILAHEYLPEYDESLYIDNSVALKVAPQLLFDTLLPEDAVMALARHSFRGPLRDEYAAVVEQHLDAAWVCEEQRTHYEQTDPAALEVPTLWSGLMLRRHNVPAVQAVMQIWWENVLRYSRRDQLSLPIALSTATFVPVVHELDNHSSDYHEWPRWVAETTRPGRIRVLDGPDLRIVELEGSSAELRQEMARMEKVGVERDAIRVELNALRVECDLLRRKTDAIRVERDTFAEATRQLDACIREIRMSTSWRMTRPARSLTGAIRSRRASRRVGSPGVGYPAERRVLEPLPRRT